MSTISDHIASLTYEERVFLERLSVFPSVFDELGASAVCDVSADEAIVMLRNLEAASLIEYDAVRDYWQFAPLLQEALLQQNDRDYVGYQVERSNGEELYYVFVEELMNQIELMYSDAHDRDVADAMLCAHTCDIAKMHSNRPSPP